jgi:hypothetical protein
MLERLGPADDPCSLFRNCYQHFNARGYGLLGEVVADQLAHLDVPLPDRGSHATD